MSVTNVGGRARSADSSPARGVEQARRLRSQVPRILVTLILDCWACLSRSNQNLQSPLRFKYQASRITITPPDPVAMPWEGWSQHCLEVRRPKPQVMAHSDTLRAQV